jgi:ATP-binding cassette subfamily C protein LapB
VLTNPQVWLLDEPTSNMDDELERRCIELLKQKMTPEHTTVIVTHKPSILPLVSRLIVVAQHRIVMDGPRDVILQQLAQSGQEQTKRDQAMREQTAKNGMNNAPGATA